MSGRGAGDESDWPAELDALAAAARHHTLVLENELVRVLDTRVGPGERTALHTHRWPSVLHLTSVAPFIRRDAAGNVMLDTRATPMPSTPTTVFALPLAPHSLENVGDVEIRALCVEIKRAPG